MDLSALPVVGRGETERPNQGHIPKLVIMSNMIRHINTVLESHDTSART